MPIIRTGLRPAFAALVIAHGLAHSVLPLSGWMDPGWFGRDFMPLYGTAVVGFTTAGIGLLGITLFTAFLLYVAGAAMLWPFNDGRFTTNIPAWRAAINMMVEGLRS